MPEDDYADLDGVRLHYVSEGDGDPVVLLHGFPDFWYSWRNQIPALAEAGYRAIAPDMRGYNLSDKPHGVDQYSIEKLTGDVSALIRHLGYDQATVVGHDWGGIVAWYFAMQHQDQLDKLVILNAPHPLRVVDGFTNPRQWLKSWYVFLFQIPWLPERLLEVTGTAPSVSYRRTPTPVRSRSKMSSVTSKPRSAQTLCASRSTITGRPAGFPAGSGRMSASSSGP